MTLRLGHFRMISGPPSALSPTPSQCPELRASPRTWIPDGQASPDHVDPLFVLVASWSAIGNRNNPVPTLWHVEVAHRIRPGCPVGGSLRSVHVVPVFTDLYTPATSPFGPSLNSVPTAKHVVADSQDTDVGSANVLKVWELHARVVVEITMSMEVEAAVAPTAMHEVETHDADASVGESHPPGNAFLNQVTPALFDTRMPLLPPVAKQKVDVAHAKLVTGAPPAGTVKAFQFEPPSVDRYSKGVPACRPPTTQVVALRQAAESRFLADARPAEVEVHVVPWLVLRSVVVPPTVTQVEPEHPIALSELGPTAAPSAVQLEAVPTCLKTFPAYPTPVAKHSDALGQESVGGPKCNPGRVETVDAPQVDPPLLVDSAIGIPAPFVPSIVQVWTAQLTS